MSKQPYPYAHSDDAYQVVKSLAKYRLVAPAFVKEEQAKSFDAILSDRVEISTDSIHTVTFKAIDKVKGLQKHYNDIDMIGRHYLIQSDESDKKRHYTISNCMKNSV